MSWPYDANQHDPMASMRVPVIATPYPGWKYIAAYVDVDAGPIRIGSAERPTHAEAGMLASFIQEYREYWFNESYQARLLQRPLDVDSGCNTAIFIKYGPDDWGYRRDSWRYGPDFIPLAPGLREGRTGDGYGPKTLERVMDHVHTYGGAQPSDRWLRWKAAHPEVFGA